MEPVEPVFTEDPRYRPSPYEEAKVGHAVIRASWLDDERPDVHGPVAASRGKGRDAVVRLEVRYGDPVRQKYRHL